MAVASSDPVREPAPERTPEPLRRGAPWSVGAVGLAAVLAIVLHVGAAQDLLAVLRGARPAWVVAAVALQTPTYLGFWLPMRPGMLATRQPMAGRCRPPGHASGSA